MSKRLDLWLAENGMAKSRERAKELVKNGSVSVDGKIITKPSATVDENSIVTVAKSEQEYVGRGALKLKTAFEKFGLIVEGKCCGDIGASTGGFTQIMLENGARKVYAIDVGHGQLAKELIGDKRVVNCEGVNVRSLTKDFFQEPVELMAGDLSFISLKLVVPVLKECIEKNGDMVMLIKPQFEAGKQALNKKGIVKDKKDHIRVLDELLHFFEDTGLQVKDLKPSSIKGGDGNIEYLVWLENSATEVSFLNGINLRNFVDDVFEQYK